MDDDYSCKWTLDISKKNGANFILLIRRLNVVYCADIYHCAIVIEVIWKRILLLGSENLTKMIQYIIVADKDADSIFVVVLVELTSTDKYFS